MQSILKTHLRPWLAAILLLVAALPTAPVPVARAANIPVTTTDDEFDTDPAECSLREAIQAANSDTAFGGCPAGGGADVIDLPAGTYTLAHAGIEDNNVSGYLDILSDITINGAEAIDTIIDGNQLDHVLQVQSGHNVAISGVTIQGGATTT